METDYWRSIFRRLNYGYLSLIREIALSDDVGFASNVLGIDPATLKILVEADDRVLAILAEIGVTMFRIETEHIKKAISLAEIGQDHLARALLTAEALIEPNNSEVWRG